MTMTRAALPDTQHAVQLVGPSELRHNPRKEVFQPGPHQILAKVEAVGLCFSDLKLLKQFAEHPRKSQVVSGIDPQVLGQWVGAVSSGPHGDSLPVQQVCQ